LKEVWDEPQARTFTIFIFVSMLAYSAQDLILEPYAGAVFAYTPGASTKLTGVQHGGVLAGMIAVALASTWLPVSIRPSLRSFTMAGCLASAATLLMIAAAGLAPESWPLSKLVFLLGFFNGAFAVAAIGSMMALIADGRESREGVRMGLWGAAQGIAFGVGGLIGAAAVDIFRLILVSPVVSYASVFTLEAGLFILSAALAARIGGSMAAPSRPGLATDLGRSMMAEAAE
jgi:BCD family chlorophyll transporter-like MFS transporter